MCPLGNRVCLSSGSQSVPRFPGLDSPTSFTGLWKESSGDGGLVIICPALLADEQRQESGGM